ncbi:MAG: hypothetical protein COC05_00655 [Gammaproteobacteria bacterium]|nr:MAG: hypothetical protein COC05_00655 [Gammaproteobacteria bacterium]
MTVSTLSKTIALSLLVLSLSACDKAGDDTAKTIDPFAINPLSPENQVYPTEALTWNEWVAYDSPNRSGFDRYYHLGKGTLDFSKWKAEDLLPAEVFKHRHRNMCELPNEIRDALRYGGGLAIRDINELLALAEYGYAEAQSLMSNFCDDRGRQYAYNERGSLVKLPGDKKPVSARAALYWAQRGAASGNALAQWRLVQCMHDIYLFQDNHPDKVSDPIELDPFWYDKAQYWLEQSVENGLIHDAVHERWHWAYIAGFPKSENPRFFIERYKWKRLWEIQGNFRLSRDYNRHFDEAVSFNGSKALAYGYKFLAASPHSSDKTVAQAEKEVGEWLRAHPDVWHNIYEHGYIERPGSEEALCVGEPGYDAFFDFDWLNKELAQYDIQVPLPVRVTLTDR